MFWNLSECYCTATFNASRFRRFVKANNIVAWNRGRTACHDWALYLSRGRDSSRGELCWPDNGSRKYQPYYLDHARLFKTITGRFILVSHSYGQLDEIGNLNAWTAACGIAVDIYDSSRDWYFPGEPHTGHTSLLVWHLPSVAVPLE